MNDLLSTGILVLVALTGFVLVALSANQVAKYFQRIRLPLITGLIFTGILAGPYILGLIHFEAIDRLSYINDFSLSYIAFAAGAELYLLELRSKIRFIQINAITQSIVGFLLGAAIVFMITDFIPFAESLPLESRLSISLLIGVLFVAPSPASVIPVIGELRAKGPFTKTTLGITMVKDFIVVIMFAVVLSVSKSFVNGYGLNFEDLLVIVVELALSFVMAYLLGKLLHLILKYGRTKWLKSFLVLITGKLTYTFSHFAAGYSGDNFGHEVYFEPLLICLIASFYITNYTRYRPEFLKILNDIAIYVYVAFFTLTGASMNLDVLGEVWLLALVFFTIRLVTLVIGAVSGNLLTGEQPAYYKVAWMPYVAQAGVALGLVTVVANEFPSWGSDFATVCIAVIILNQLIGPPLIAKAITMMGENRQRAAIPEFDGVKDALIFGLESQSIALAMQLKKNGWIIELVTKKEQQEIETIDGITFHFIDDVTGAFFDKVDAKKYDVIIGMLSDKENLEICEAVYENVGTKDMIIRLNDPAYRDRFLKLGVRVVDPYTAMVSLLDHMVRSPQATSILLGMETGQDSRDIVLRNPDLHGITLRDLRLPSDVIILSLKRGDNMIITHGYTRMRQGDVLTFVGSDKSLDMVQLKFGR